MSSHSDKEHLLQWVNKLYRNDLESTREPMIHSDSLYNDTANTPRYSSVTSLIGKRHGQNFDSTLESSDSISEYRIKSNFKNTEHSYHNRQEGHDAIHYQYASRDVDSMSDETEDLLDNSVYYPVNMTGELNTTLHSQDEAVLEILNNQSCDRRFIALTPSYRPSSSSVRKLTHIPSSPISPKHSYISGRFSPSKQHISSYDTPKPSFISNYIQTISKNQSDISVQLPMSHDTDFGTRYNFHTTVSSLGKNSISETSVISNGSPYIDPVSELLSSTSFKRDFTHAKRQKEQKALSETDIKFQEEKLIKMKHHKFENRSDRTPHNDRVSEEPGQMKSTLLSPEYRKLKDFFSSQKVNKEPMDNDVIEISNRVSSGYISANQSFNVQTKKTNHSFKNRSNKYHSEDNKYNTILPKQIDSIYPNFIQEIDNHAQKDNYVDEEMIEIDKMLKELQIETSVNTRHSSILQKHGNVFDVLKNEHIGKHSDKDNDHVYQHKNRRRSKIPISTRAYKNSRVNISTRNMNGDSTENCIVQDLQPTEISTKVHKYIRKNSPNEAFNEQTNTQADNNKGIEYEDCWLNFSDYDFDSDLESQTDKSNMHLARTDGDAFDVNALPLDNQENVAEGGSLISETPSYISSEIESVRILLQFLIQNQNESNEEMKSVMQHQDTMLKSDLLSEKSFSSVTTDQTLLDAKRLLLQHLPEKRQLERIKDADSIICESDDFEPLSATHIVNKKDGSQFYDSDSEFYMDSNLSSVKDIDHNKVDRFYKESYSGKNGFNSYLWPAVKKETANSELFLSGGNRDGQLETLKHMLFNLQKINKETHAESELLDTFLGDGEAINMMSVKTPIIETEKETVNQDETLSRAYTHLNNLKTILNERKSITNPTINDDDDYDDEDEI